MFNKLKFDFLDSSSQKKTLSFVVGFALLVAFLPCGFAAEKPLSSPEPTSTATYVEQINFLKERQDLLVEADAKNFERIKTTLEVVGVVFSLLTILIVFRQFQEQSRQNKLEDENMKDAKVMMKSVKDNIDAFNALMTMLKDTFKFQKDITDSMEKIDSQIKTLDESRKQDENSFVSRVGSLNNLAAEVFSKCQFQSRDREAFKLEDNRIALNSVTSLVTTLEQISNISGLASPVVVFLRAMSRFNSMEYEEAVSDLREARNDALAQLESPRKQQYGKWNLDETKANLCALNDESCYHLGIIYYNLGKYPEARKEFKAAYEKNKLDFRSRIYIPELLFFESDSDPHRVEDEFKAVERELEDVATADRSKMKPTWDSHYASLKMKQGNLYLKKNAFRADRRLAWEKHEDQTAAISCYWSANDKNPNNVFVKFSLAQAMITFPRGSACWKSLSPEKLFREAFYSFCNEAVVKTEPILLTVLYYCAAISCFHAEISGQTPSQYLMQARQHLRRVPKNIRIFAPLNKINMKHEEILDEMKRLEIFWEKK